MAPTASQRAKDNIFFLKILALSHPLELSIEEIPSSDGILSAILGLILPLFIFADFSYNSLLSVRQRDPI